LVGLFCSITQIDDGLAFIDFCDDRVSGASLPVEQTHLLTDLCP
jgi:hypothetical protein